MIAMHAVANRRIGTSAAKKLIYPAADRNKDAILKELKRIICPGSSQIFLEIASGSGQHIAHFAPNFPQITFYPSECDTQLFESISAHVSGLANVNEPLFIDISSNYKTWSEGIFPNSSIDYIYSANMIHISPYKCTIGLFNAAGHLLKPKGTLVTYGPYAINGVISPESNVNFDRSLKSQNREWGLRDIKDLETLAKDNEIQLVEILDMPANNKTLVWKKN